MSKITLLVTDVSGKSGPGRREFVNKIRHLIIVGELISFRLKVSDIVLKFMKLIIGRFTISHHEFIEGVGGESFDSSIIEAIFILESCP